MKIILLILLAIVLFYSYRFWRLGIKSRAMNSTLGVQNGKLLPCGIKPNCVCSIGGQDVRSQIEPIKYSGNTGEAIANLIIWMDEKFNSELVVSEFNYLHFVVYSGMFRFADDLEFYFSQEGVIQVRSASRVGHSDIGANRKRVEKIRGLFEKTNKK